MEKPPAGGANGGQTTAASARPVSRKRCRRIAELLSRNLGSLDGHPGEHRVKVVGKGNEERFLPIEQPLERILDRYLETRR